MKLNKLYQRAANQKVNTFQVETQGNLYRTITGFEDGIKTKSAWTECFGKNIGKANETSDVEQARKEAEALHRKKLESSKMSLFNPALCSVYRGSFFIV